MPGLERFHRFDVVVVIQHDRDVVPLALDLAIDHRIAAGFHDGGVHTFVLEHAWSNAAQRRTSTLVADARLLKSGKHSAIKVRSCSRMYVWYCSQ